MTETGYRPPMENSGRRKEDVLWIRARMIQAIRNFFIFHDYLEVETPYRVPAPAPEVHIDAPCSGDWFLHTSPELCMKRLLAAGYPLLFQICKCFRKGERGTRHLPEFTMLEWYHAGIDYGELMKECEELLSSLFIELGCGDTLSYQGKSILLTPPWQRIALAEAFSLYAPLPLAQALKSDSFDEIMALHIEPRLGMERPTFVYDYPLHHGSLARSKKDDPTLSERFELYIGGLELANGFSELKDAKEQRSRFQDAEMLRLTGGKAAYPVPGRFLEVLEAMPNAAGIALGLDRLAMIITDRDVIDDVVAFTPEDL